MQSNLSAALDFQNKILPKVSRSFALTIPQLPLSLRDAVANCYLWCRITDSVEDDPDLNSQEKLYFHKKIILAINGKLNLKDLVTELLEKLSTRTDPNEKTLIKHMELIKTVTDCLPKSQAKIINKCVTIMNNLMPRFQSEIIGLQGLGNLRELKKYCYAVAGIVGETLNELFGEYLNLSKAKQYKLLRLARDFGQGLQITNILKDRWDDYRRGICWLPRSFFSNKDLNLLLQDPQNPVFIKGIKHLIAINYNKLIQAFRYCLNIPANQAGIRKFCLWAIGMAIATLNNINQNPKFTEVKQIKVSRNQVKWMMLITNSIVKYNWMLKLWFKWCSRSLNKLASYNH